MSEREERVRQQLERGMREERDNCLKKQLSTFIESWQTDAQQWKKQQSELQEKLQEQESLRKQQEEERKQETERFQENFQQPWTLPVFVLPASPVPRKTDLLSVSDHALCFRVSSFNLLPRLAPHQYLCLAARLWTPPLGHFTKSKPIPFP
ncbi:mastermind-like protein 2 [Takifugu flavidus]|uniref:mastermind-like protein 2 n=1 Tax=Takifugu flavidus TaxID=433684 RepID=UPI00254457B2|nr:mastermind-like protein 2 [Takifugu flavidus]